MVHGIIRDFFAAGGMQLNAGPMNYVGTFLTVMPSMIGSQQAVVLGFDNPAHLAEPTVRTVERLRSPDASR